MISITFFLSFLFFFPSAFAHDHNPGKRNDHFGTGVTARVFKKLDSFSLKFEVGGGQKYEGQKYSYIEFGSYYKLENKQKIGLFLGEYRGLRHTNDWVIKGDDWIWVDSSDRKEYLLNFVYSKKFRSSALSPNLYEVKIKYQKNSHEGQELIVLRPGFHHFHLKRGQPIWSLNMTLPLYFPLNFEESTIYKKGIYSAFLWHLNLKTVLGLSYKYTVETWTDSDDSKELRSTQPYRSEDHIQELGVEIIFQI